MSRPPSPSRPENLERNRSFGISILAFGCPVLGVLLLIALAESTDSWAWRIFVLPFIAGLQNHLQILLHEGAHRQIHPNRRANDFLTNLFCSIPFFGFLSHYRKFHLDHHRRLLDADLDPEVSFYAEQGYRFERLSRAQWARLFFLDFCGYHYLQFFFSYRRYVRTEIRAGRLARPTPDERATAFFALVVVLAVASFLPKVFLGGLFYWVLPQGTFLFLFLKLQGYGEHTERASSVAACTLSHDSGFVVRFFVYPLNSDRHREHHLYPTVPWYRLRSFRI